MFHSTMAFPVSRIETEHPDSACSWLHLDYQYLHCVDALAYIQLWLLRWQMRTWLPPISLRARCSSWVVSKRKNRFLLEASMFHWLWFGGTKVIKPHRNSLGIAYHIVTLRKATRRTPCGFSRTSFIGLTQLICIYHYCLTRKALYIALYHLSIVLWH